MHEIQLLYGFIQRLKIIYIRILKHENVRKIKKK